MGLAVLFITIGLRTHSYWEAYFSNAPDRSWDGSGHVALLQIYDKTVFPDTFGWTNAFFAGMPFPNFYPPLWYWSVSALHHFGSPLTLTYKLVLLGSIILIPLVLARLSFVITGCVGASAATLILCLIPLLEVDMMPRYAAGLTLPSTFNEGIYTEPLGFVLLILTITSLLQMSDWSYSLRSGVLLSGTMLANLFTFVAAPPFLIAVCLYPASKRRSRMLNVCIVSAVTCLLTAFWIVPVLTHYKYFVTVPVRPPLNEVISPALWCWLAVGGSCAAWSFLRLGERMKVYNLGLLISLLGCVCAYAPGLEGLPLQLPRLVAILAVLVAVPIAIIARLLFYGALQLANFRPTTKSTAIFTLLAICICFAGFLPLCTLEVRIHSQENTADMYTVLNFAELHRDGKYMVQTPHLYRDRFEARALSSYLGAQGNEAATVVFRESSISSIFYVPLENKISSLQQAFGISSSLDNDRTFLDESSSLTDSQLQELGIHYLVRLKKEQWRRSASGTTVQNAGKWEIIELPSSPVPEMESLPNRPVLLFSDISYKRRHAGQLEANRFFEEQFRSGNFTTRLALLNVPTIDLATHLDSFGALILNKFSVRDEDVAFTLIKNFSQKRPVILIPDSSSFCRRLLSHRGELPKLVIVEAGDSNEGGWLDEKDASYLQRTQITEAWKRIEDTLRVSSTTSPVTLKYQNVASDSQASTVLLHRTFDPSWQSHDGSLVYLAGPSATLILSKSALPLTFRRNEVEKRAVLASSLSALCIGLLLASSITSKRSTSSSLS